MFTVATVFGFTALPLPAQTITIRRFSTYIDGPGFNDTREKNSPEISDMPLSDSMQGSDSSGGATFAIAQTFPYANGAGLYIRVNAQAGQFLPIGTHARCSAEFEEKLVVHLDPQYERRYSFSCIFELFRNFSAQNAPSPQLTGTYGFGRSGLVEDDLDIHKVGFNTIRLTQNANDLSHLFPVKNGDELTAKFSIFLDAGCRSEASQSSSAEGGVGLRLTPVKDFSPPRARTATISTQRSEFESSLSTRAGLFGLRVLDENGQPVDPPPGAIRVDSPFGPVPVFGLSIPGFDGTDDFDDDAKDEAKWGPNTGAGALKQINQHLEYSSDSTTAQSAEWPWIQDAAPSSDSWDLITDVNIGTADLPPGARAAIGLGVSSGTNSALIALEAAHENGMVEKRFRAEMTSPGMAAVPIVRTGSSSAALRLHFDGISKELSFWFDPDGAAGGSNWQFLLKGDLDGSEHWGLTDSSWFHARIFGESSGISVPPGQVYADNFFGGAAPTLRPTIRPPELALGSVTLRGAAQPNRFLTIESSDDLSLWLPAKYVENSAAGEFNSTFPQETSRGQFFRVRY